MFEDLLDHRPQAAAGSERIGMIIDASVIHSRQMARSTGA
jgi:hypothetical protein